MSKFKKVVSKKQLAANRANAQKSHGPVTPEGRAISAQNATQHGLTGRFKVLKGESQEDFEELFRQFVADEKPIGSAELELVRRMAEYTWLRSRASRFHESCFFVEEQTPELREVSKACIRVNPELDKFIRHQAHYERCYSRAASELLRRQKQRYLLQNGFDLQKRADAAQRRTEKRELQHDEMFKTRHATAEARRECAQADAIIKTAHAVGVMERKMAA